MTSSGGQLRIGELGRRVGLTPDVLRAWERRYGVIRPERSGGGLRLYSDADEARVREMKRHMGSGLSAAEAARAALAADRPPSRPRERLAPAPELNVDAATLADAFRRLDDALAQATIDRLISTYAFEIVATQVLFPYLADLGSRWQRGAASIAEEHLATQVLRGRLLALARARVPSDGPRAILAGPPDELHDLGLVILAVALDRLGWRVTLLGANTPVASVADAARTLDADAVVIAASTEQRLARSALELHALAGERRLFLAGPGATEDIARRVAAGLLGGDPFQAAEALAGGRSTASG